MRLLIFIICVISILSSCKNSDNTDIFSESWAWQNSDSLFKNKIPRYEIYHVDSASPDYKLMVDTFQNNEIKPWEIKRIIDTDTLVKKDSISLIITYEGNMVDTANFKSIHLSLTDNTNLKASIIIASNTIGIGENKRIYSMFLPSSNLLITKEIILVSSDIINSGLFTRESGGFIRRVTKLLKIDFKNKDFEVLDSKEEKFEVDFITNKFTNKTKVKLNKL